MKKLLTALVLSLLAWPLWAKSPVWQVNKGADVFYLAGTVHVLRPADHPLPTALLNAFAKADQLMLETDLNALQQPEMAALMQQTLMYPAGQQLGNLLTPPTRQALEQLLAKHGLSLQAVQQFKPGALAAQLTMALVRQSGFTAEGVDSFLLTEALKAGKSTAFLESPQFQLQMMAELGQGREDAFIRFMLAESADAGGQLTALVDAWRQGDLAKLKLLALDELQQQDPQSFQQLFLARNQAWLSQLQALNGNDKVELVLVGAGHLAGPDGLVAMLEQAGYQLTQLD